MLNLSTLVCSNYCTVSISDDNMIYSMGYNAYCKLGFETEGSTIFPPTPIPNLINIKMIDCGMDHTVALNFEGEVFTFGNNSYGELGINIDKNTLHHTHIPQKLELPPIQQIVCGSHFVICLSENGLLYSFGSNRDGQLGLGELVDSSCSKVPIQIPNLKNIEFIVCGASCVICKSFDNVFYGWGNNTYNNVSQSKKKSIDTPEVFTTVPNDIISIKCGDNHSIFLSNLGTIYSCGDNYYGQCGIGKNKPANSITQINDIPCIQRIECGKSNSMCIDIDDNLWIFGGNYCGQSGLGDISSIYKPKILESIGKVLDISHGGARSFFKTINNEIYASGGNTYAQLGIEKFNGYQRTPIKVLNDKKYIWKSVNRKSRAKSARK